MGHTKGMFILSPSAKFHKGFLLNYIPHDSQPGYEANLASIRGCYWCSYHDIDIDNSNGSEVNAQDDLTPPLELCIRTK